MVGVGTVVYALAIGPLLHVLLPRVQVTVPAPGTPAGDHAVLAAAVEPAGIAAEGPFVEAEQDADRADHQVDVLARSTFIVSASSLLVVVFEFGGPPPGTKRAYGRVACCPASRQRCWWSSSC